MANANNYRQVWGIDDSRVQNAAAMLQRVKDACDRVDGTSSYEDVEDALRSVEFFVSKAKVAMSADRMPPPTNSK
jgi:ligand-binding sensor protein